jgi:hypothetical protein
MGKHESGYPRIPRDLYPTPTWPVEALLEHVSVKGLRILEPACGTGGMSEALKAAGALVHSTDIEDYGYAGFDGLADFTLSNPIEFRLDAIVTNAVWFAREIGRGFHRGGPRPRGRRFYGAVVAGRF